jgi:hypothetical protein
MGKFLEASLAAFLIIQLLNYPITNCPIRLELFVLVWFSVMLI